MVLLQGMTFFKGRNLALCEADVFIDRTRLTAGPRTSQDSAARLSIHLPLQLNTGQDALSSPQLTGDGQCLGQCRRSDIREEDWLV
ncbi:hypothetical protein DPEC_G00270470 [Dallia pectoralis]|uniref:Uncharacterized protein n=1 Tax=Dallia pectoralis TaxID=75939 RepID=A0ACC2FPF3_DALPE|nr:hypothetical protein DPEC_G00270470 [Dallia pectoralis]